MQGTRTATAQNSVRCEDIDFEFRVARHRFAALLRPDPEFLLIFFVAAKFVQIVAELTDERKDLAHELIRL